MTKLEQLERKRRRLDSKQTEIDKLKREVIKNTLAAIFEALGINVQVGLNYLSHSSGGVKVSYVSTSDLGTFGDFHLSQGQSYFTVEAMVKDVKLVTAVLDATSTRLQAFKQLLETKNVSTKF